MRGTGLWKVIVVLSLALPLATASVLRATVAGTSAIASTHTSAASPAPFPRSLPITGYALAVDERAGRAYVASDGGIDVIDTRAGTLVRTVAVGKGHPFAVAADAAAMQVYAAASFPGTVVALDARSGAVLSRARVRGLPRALAPVPGTHLLVVATAHERDTGEPGVVDVLDTRSGVVRQVVTRSQADFVAIAVDARTGRAFVADETGTVIMIDARRGRLLRTTPVGEFPSIVAIAPGGAGFVGTADGVDVLDARTGARLRTLAHTGIVAAITMDPARGRVFVADFGPGDYSVYTFDARTAAPLHTTNPDPTNVGKAPVALAVDPARGRAYALLGSELDKNFLPVGPASVATIDAATGALRTSVNLGDTLTLAGGGRTFGLAVDTHARRLIALTDTKVIVLDTTHL